MPDATSSGPGPTRDFGDSDLRYRSVGSALVTLLEDVRGAETRAQAAQATLEGLVAAFGASRGLLLLVGGPLDQPSLVPIAAVGAQSALVREMPTIDLRSDADVARVAGGSVPIFRGDVHGMGADDAGRLNGLARWRVGVGVQAEAILPLTAREQVIGVLSLEWSCPQALDAGQRRSLATAAESTGLILDVFSKEGRALVDVRGSTLDEATGGRDDSSSEGESAPSEPPVAPEIPVTAQASSVAERPTPEDEAPVGDDVGSSPPPVMTLTVTTDGLVVPPTTSVAWAGSPRLTVQAVASAGTVGEAVFWDAFPARDGLVAMALGMVRAPNGRSKETAESARRMLRAAAMQGCGPSRGLGLVEGWLAASVPGPAWISAVVCHLDIRMGILAACGVGSTAVASRLADGRSEIQPAPVPPLGSSVGVVLADSYRVLLTGDHVLLCCGDIDRLETRRGRAHVSETLLGVSGVRGAKALARLVESTHGPGGVAGVVGMEVIG